MKWLFGLILLLILTAARFYAPYLAVAECKNGIQGINLHLWNQI